MRPRGLLNLITYKLSYRVRRAKARLTIREYSFIGIICDVGQHKLTTPRLRFCQLIDIVRVTNFYVVLYCIVLC